MKLRIRRKINECDGMNTTMNDSLYVCKEHFAEYWGQRLVNTMRALHGVKYNDNDLE